MDWLTGLLKHLRVKTSLVVGGFAATIVMYVGPRVAPAYVDPVPKDCASLLVGLMTFFGVLSLGALAVEGWGLLCRGSRTAAGLWKAARQPGLSQAEITTLLAMALHPDKPCDLNHWSGSSERIKLEAMMTGLCQRGLVAFNAFDRSFVSITDKGKGEAAKLYAAGHRARA